MSLLDKLTSWFPVTISSDQAIKLSKLNPDRFSIQDVCGILSVSPRSAKWICETAVRRGEFAREDDFYRLCDKRP